MEDNQSGVIEKKADTITKTQEALEGQSIAQKEPEKGVYRNEDTPAKSHASQGALKMKAIDWDAFTQEAKPTTPKYTWDHVEEADEQYGKLLWTTCFDDTCPIHYSNKKGSRWFPQEPKHKNKKKRTPQPSWYEKPSKEEQATNPAHSESLYMMEVPPPYERRFEVIN